MASSQNAKLLLDIRSPWGEKNEVRFWADPKMTWKVFINQILTAFRLDVINGDDGFPAIKLAKQQGDKRVPLTCNFYMETLERLGIKHEDKIYVVEVERSVACLLSLFVST